MFPELAYLAALVGAARRRVVRDPEGGATTMEWVIITAITVTAAVVAGTIIIAKIRSKANSILTDTPQ